jgi:hypothetical protein
MVISGFDAARDGENMGFTRVRTMRIGLPQQVQLTTGRGLVNGMNIRLISCTSLTSLLLGCRKPKLRARLNPLGRMCSKIRRRNSTPLRVRVSHFFVLLS